MEELYRNTRIIYVKEKIQRRGWILNSHIFWRDTTDNTKSALTSEARRKWDRPPQHGIKPQKRKETSWVGGYKQPQSS